MKLYFAGADRNIICNDILLSAGVTNRLLSFYSINKKQFNTVYKNFFLDSGAFSVVNTNKTIDINNYVNFIKDNIEYIELYSTLDVIGDHIKTYENTIYMEKMGLSPLPVFHYKSPYEHLNHLVEKYDYIALGGLVPLASRKKVLIQWLDSCFEIIQDKIKVHCFGIFSKEILKRYPFYSADSSSWISSLKYGKLKPDERYKIVLNSVNEFVKLEKYITKYWSEKSIKTI